MFYDALCCVVVGGRVWVDNSLTLEANGRGEGDVTYPGSRDGRGGNSRGLSGSLWRSVCWMK